MHVTFINTLQNVQCPVDIVLVYLLQLNYMYQYFFRFLFQLLLLDIVIPVKTWT